MKIIEKKISDLKAYENNPRNNDGAVEYVANSIKEFGFKNPVIIDKDNVIVCGHTRVKAAKSLKMKTVPCIVADDLTEEQIKAFRLADNKVSEFSQWDFPMLEIEMADIEMLDMSDFGFGKLEEDEGDNDIEINEDYNEGYNVIIRCENLDEAEALGKLLHVDFDFTRQKIACKYSDIKA